MSTIVKHTIAAIILAVSASAHAQGNHPSANHKTCTFMAESVDHMLQGLEQGLRPNEVLQLFTQAARESGVTGEVKRYERLLSIALMSAGEGRRSGLKHMAEVYTMCMNVK